MVILKNFIKSLGNNVADLLLKVIKNPSKTIFWPIFHTLLWVPSIFFAFIILLRYQLYKLRILPSVKLPCPVISVGNMTVGGTGKTPFVKFLAEYFRSKGYKIAILSRGYKRPIYERRRKTRDYNIDHKKDIYDNHHITIVSDFQNIQTTWYNSGDEPYLLAESLPGVAVIVGPNRKKTAHFAIHQLGANMILLDDGFSHLKLRRDFDIVLIDVYNPFGFGYCLPRGLLREPLRALSRANAIVLTRSQSQSDLSNLILQIQKICQNKPLFKSEFYFQGFVNLITGEILFPVMLGGKRILVISGIGNPQAFENDLKAIRLDIRQHIIFPDHYIYHDEDIELIRKYTLEESIDWIVTTRKDAIKIKHLLKSTEANWYYAEIDIKLNIENQFWNLINQNIKSTG